MRWLAGAILAAAFGLPAQANDDLASSILGLVPLGDTMLAVTTGGAAPPLGLGTTAEASAPPVDLSAASSLQASISRSSAYLAGAVTTGDISLGEGSGAAGGVNSLQLSTGFANIQQNSAALAFAF
jgi:hypothetical protein